MGMLIVTSELSSMIMVDGRDDIPLKAHECLGDVLLVFTSFLFARTFKILMMCCLAFDHVSDHRHCLFKSYIETIFVIALKMNI